jgi:hypothetical protein
LKNLQNINKNYCHTIAIKGENMNKRPLSKEKQDALVGTAERLFKYLSEYGTTIPSKDGMSCAEGIIKKGEVESDTKGYEDERKFIIKKHILGTSANETMICFMTVTLDVTFAPNGTHSHE